jgi:hypothetical protein
VVGVVVKGGGREIRTLGRGFGGVADECGDGGRLTSRDVINDTGFRLNWPPPVTGGGAEVTQYAVITKTASSSATPSSAGARNTVGWSTVTG